MIVLGLDLETTGLNTAEDRVIELGWVLWCTEKNKALVVHNSLVWDESYPVITEEITGITGITLEDLHRYSVTPTVAFTQLMECVEKYTPVAVVAHNGENFDKPLILADLHRNGFLDSPFQKLHWVDSRTDLPFETPPQSAKLGHLAYDMGFINPFPHRAFSDVLTMLKVMSQFPFERVLAESHIPSITVRAVIDFDNKQRAKDRRFSWEKIGEETFPKWWVKKIKENKFQEEAEAIKPFQLVRVK